MRKVKNSRSLDLYVYVLSAVVIGLVLANILISFYMKDVRYGPYISSLQNPSRLIPEPNPPANYCSSQKYCIDYDTVYIKDRYCKIMQYDCTSDRKCSSGNCILKCGDGVPDVGETCDDGNLVDGDGCDSLCQTEQASCEISAHFNISYYTSQPQQNYPITYTADELCGEDVSDYWLYWDFGDGFQGYGGSSVTRNYVNPGTYAPSLTIYSQPDYELIDSYASQPVEVLGGMSLVGTLYDSSIGGSEFVTDLVVSGGVVWVAKNNPTRILKNTNGGTGIPVLLNVTSYFGNSHDLDSSGDLVAYAAGYGGVYLLRTDPGNLQNKIGTFNSVNVLGEEAFALALNGNLLYVALGLGGIAVLDISNPANIQVVNHITSGYGAGIGSAKKLEILGDTLYVGDVVTQTLRIYGISNPSNPVQVNSLSLAPASVNGIIARGNVLVIIKLVGGLIEESIYDVSDPFSPVFRSTIYLDSVSSVAIVENKLFLGYLKSVQEYDINNISSPRPVEGVDVGNTVIAISYDNGYIYVGRLEAVVTKVAEYS